MGWVARIVITPFAFGYFVCIDKRFRAKRIYAIFTVRWRVFDEYPYVGVDYFPCPYGGIPYFQIDF
jgi:hypothetical protein